MQEEERLLVCVTVCFWLCALTFHNLHSFDILLSLLLRSLWDAVSLFEPWQLSADAKGLCTVCFEAVSLSFLCGDKRTQSYMLLLCASRREKGGEERE